MVRCCNPGPRRRASSRGFQGRVLVGPPMQPMEPRVLSWRRRPDRTSAGDRFTSLRSTDPAAIQSVVPRASPLPVRRPEGVACTVSAETVGCHRSGSSIRGLNAGALVARPALSGGFSGTPKAHRGREVGSKVQVAPERRSRAAAKARSGSGVSCHHLPEVPRSSAHCISNVRDCC